LSKKPFYYSLYDNTADAYATDPLFEKDGVSFGAHVLGETLPLMKLHAYGEKMLSNAIGAILTSKILGVNNNEIEEAIFNFSMPKRRTEFKTNINGIYVFDDHADHPTEVEATLSSLRMHFPDERIIAIFQPHRYTMDLSLQEEIDCEGTASPVVKMRMCSAVNYWDVTVTFKDAYTLTGTAVQYVMFQPDKDYVYLLDFKEKRE